MCRSGRREKRQSSFDGEAAEKGLTQTQAQVCLTSAAPNLSADRSKLCSRKNS